MKNFSICLPFSMFCQDFLACAKEYINYFIISVFTFKSFENCVVFPGVAAAFCKTRVVFHVLRIPKCANS